MSTLGWRFYGDSKLFPPSRMHEVMKKTSLTPAQIKTLAGNSMHLRTQMTFMLFCLAQIIKKQSGRASLSRASTWMDDEEQ